MLEMLAVVANAVLAYSAIMDATLIIRDRRVYAASMFVEVVVWQVPSPVPPSVHQFKYRLVYIEDGKRVVGFDNERGKGDHLHVGEEEHPYTFIGIRQLLADFATAVRLWRKLHGRSQDGD